MRDKLFVEVDHEKRCGVSSSNVVAKYFGRPKMKETVQNYKTLIIGKDSVLPLLGKKITTLPSLVCKFRKGYIN